ncbi:MAG: hypothetical protein ABFD91_14630 [Anaerohalosphaeraceae bacterium]
MVKKAADTNIIQLIYKLAGDLSRVKTTQRVYYDLLSYNLTVRAVCDAIREWIDVGEVVAQDVTTGTESHIKSHVGKCHYIMKPVIDGQKFFIKVGIEKNEETGEYMMIISTHL